ncbi:MOSC domain-containing protein [Haloplanus litoreus]|uniref:MOSC domain-containing protein n=1 Tax=Haloplanus litoreus TaxID=767515 RepID=UPI0036149C45
MVQRFRRRTGRTPPPGATVIHRPTEARALGPQHGDSGGSRVLVRRDDRRGARRRLRPNVEIGGVPAFWEDRFLGSTPSGFEVGGIRFEGAEACARCVVPSRDPETGEPIADFQERFARRREETLPDWAPRREFEHFFTVMLITRIPDGHAGETLAVGDEVRVGDELEA